MSGGGSEARGPSPQPSPQRGEGATLPLPSGESEARGRAGVGGVRRMTSNELFINGAVELQIDHRGVLYRLKQTSLGKLILTK